MAIGLSKLGLKYRELPVIPTDGGDMPQSSGDIRAVLNALGRIHKAPPFDRIPDWSKVEPLEGAMSLVSVDDRE